MGNVTLIRNTIQLEGEDAAKDKDCGDVADDKSIVTNCFHGILARLHLHVSFTNLQI